MTDPPRLLDADADPFERELLQAAEADRGSLSARARCLAAASPVLVVTVAKTSSAALLPTALKAAGVGIAFGLVATGAVIWTAPRSASTGSALASAQVAQRDVRPRVAPVLAPPAMPVPDGSIQHAQPQDLAAAATARRRRDPHLTVSPTREPPETALPAGEPVLQATAPASALQSAFAVEPSAVAPRSSATESATQTSLQREVRLLDRAREALATRDAAAALHAVQAYEREFPRGALIPEFVYLRVQALIAAGRRAEAAAMATRFLQAHPSGAQSQKLSQLLASEHLTEPAR